MQKRNDRFESTIQIRIGKIRRRPFFVAKRRPSSKARAFDEAPSFSEAQKEHFGRRDQISTMLLTC